MQTTRASGGCICGDVKYEVAGKLRAVNYCHCEQCRKTSGHFVAATACKPENLTMIADAGLRWYQSSSSAARGFCGTCGGNVFWRPEHGKYIAIMAGTVDTPTGLTAENHIFVADASDYYAICDGLPQFADDGPPGTEE